MLNFVPFRRHDGFQTSILGNRLLAHPVRDESGKFGGSSKASNSKKGQTDVDRFFLIVLTVAR